MSEPIPAEVLAHEGRGFTELLTDGTDVYWAEHRPSTGRSVLRNPDEDVTPAPWSVGSRVHEYGGAAAAVSGNTAYFVDDADQRIYRLRRGGRRPRPLTPADRRRYGDLELDPTRNRLLAVCEDHRSGVDNYLVAVPLDGGEPQVIEEGNDFYLAPRVSPDGTQLAWVTWNLPNMPWDGTELHVSDFTESRLVAGGPEESVCHPRWSPDGVLYFVSDRSGWWNLYAFDGSTVRAVAPMDAEFGKPTAMGAAPYDVSATHIVAAVRSGGRSRLLRIDRATGHQEELPTAEWEIHQPRFASDDIVYLGGGPTRPVSVWRWNGTLLRDGLTTDIPGNLREPEIFTIPTSDGSVTHAFHYRPSPYADQPRPPLVVIAHGGPVSAATAALELGDMALMAAAFWTSRGYAVLDVNYRGSTGYGRAYREALHGRWGQVDVDDCIDAARYLVDKDLADPDRVVIRGWSAGGYTTLMALATKDFFAAGTAYFPVADLEAVRQAGHKYEAEYDHRLIGDRTLSPIYHADAITAPLLVIQGLDDPVCPAPQTERLVARLCSLGRDVDYIGIPGEGHGFHRADSIVTSLNTEAQFYARVLVPQDENPS